MYNNCLKYIKLFCMLSYENKKLKPQTIIKIEKLFQTQLIQQKLVYQPNEAI